MKPFNIPKHRFGTYIIVPLLFIIMWYIAGWSTDNVDWIPYERYFLETGEITIFDTLDIGFVYLNRFFASFGISFLQFRQILYFIFLAFVMLVILRYAKQPILVTIVYFVLLFFRDIITTRNSVAFIFLMIALLCYLSNSLKHNKLLFVLFWLLSCTFHISFLVYGVLLLSSTKIGFKTILFVSLSLALLGSQILDGIMGFEYFLQLDKLQNKAEGYLENGSYVSLIISSTTILYNYFVVSTFVRYNRRDSSINIDLYKRVNSWLLPILIFTTVNMEFIRLFNNMVLLNYIVLTNIRKDNKVPASCSILLLGWFIWLFLWIILLSGVGPQVSLIVNSIK